MNELIKHRGPDDDGFYHFDADLYTIRMAMRRLAKTDMNS